VPAKQPGERATLTVNAWEGDRPVEGDFLRTGTGRCYRIDEVRGRRLMVTVLENDAVQLGQDGVFEWRWTARE
jgi:hypothetical protein